MQAKITEKLVKERIKKVLDVYKKHNDFYTLCPMTFGYGESGHPDRILLVNSAFLGIEVKKDRNNSHTRPELKAKSSEVAQKIQAEKIKAAGGDWICAHSDNLEELIGKLDALMKVPSSAMGPKDEARVKKLTRF